MGKPQNIYWVTETEDYNNFISMQSPGRCLFPSRRKCFPKPCCRSFYIDNSNNVCVKQENNQSIDGNMIKQSGDAQNVDLERVGTDWHQSNSSCVTADQLSVLVIVPIIDSFDTDAIPLNGAANQYRVAAGGQNLDIQVNGDGTAYINGEKIEESELGDGTRVFIYRNNKVENDEE